MAAPLTIADITRDPIGSMMRARPGDNYEVLLKKAMDQERKKYVVDSRSVAGMTPADPKADHSYASTYRTGVTDWDRLFSRRTTQAMPADAYVVLRERTDGSRGTGIPAGPLRDHPDWGTRYLRPHTAPRTPGAGPPGAIASSAGSAGSASPMLSRLSAAAGRADLGQSYGMTRPGAGHGLGTHGITHHLPGTYSSPSGKAGFGDAGSGDYEMHRPVDEWGLAHDPRVVNTNPQSMRVVSKVIGSPDSAALADPAGFERYREAALKTKPMTDRLGFRYRDQYRMNTLRPRFFPVADKDQRVWEHVIKQEPRDHAINRNLFYRTLDLEDLPEPLDVRSRQRAMIAGDIPRVSAADMAYRVRVA